MGAYPSRAPRNFRLGTDGWFAAQSWTAGGCWTGYYPDSSRGEMRQTSFISTNV